MRSLVNKLIYSNFAILLRNSFKIKPVYSKNRYFKKNFSYTMSDSFMWRTDNNFKTKFKYSDILKLFYDIDDSSVEFHFFSKNNKLIKIKKVQDLNLSNELDITEKSMGIKDYGVFYIYHSIKDNDQLNIEKIGISNLCYVGYSHNDSLHSFVHGNILARYSPINSLKPSFSDTVPISLLMNHKYTIQKYFDNFDKIELCFTNPTSKKIKFQIKSNNYYLEPGHCKIIEINEELITILSNCLFLRPTIITYKKNYIDVHHS